MEKLKNKNSNGITLIALIITIIVMIILVGVTITVALNGGLFNTAQSAATNTMVEAEREQLLSAVVTAYDTETGTISKTKLQENLGNTWKVEGEEAPYTVTSPKGNKFTVSADGTIDYIGKEEKEEDIDPSTLSDLEKYILGADGKGRDLSQILDFNNWTFKQDPADTNSEIYKDVKFAYMDEGSPDIQIRYGRDVYKFTNEQKTESEINTVKKSLTKISTPEGNLGKYVTYQGKSWIVLYDDADKVELISAEALGEVTLGYEDAGAKTNVTVTDENSLTDEEQFKRGAWSYNNVITTLTEACKAETGISANIRNVGGPAEEATTENVTFEEVKNSGFTPNADLDEETLTKLKTNIESAKQGDENYKNDYDQMKALGILATDTPAYYWLASRFVGVNSSDVHFSTRCIYDGGYLGDSGVCYVLSYGNANGNNNSYAVRPVVSLSSGILDGKTGEGTSSNPINLD